MRSDPVPPWEREPAGLATHQYSQCLERVLRALPPTVQRQAAPDLLRALARMRAGLAAVYAPPAAEAALPAWSALCRSAGLHGIAASRAGLLLMRRERLASRADLTAALELLERIEAGMQRRPQTRQ